MNLRTIWWRIEWILSEVTGPVRFVWRIAHLWWVRCKWKWAGRRLLCGLEAVKYLHVGADDAMWLMDAMEESGEAARQVKEELKGVCVRPVSEDADGTEDRLMRTIDLLRARRFGEVIALLKDAKWREVDEHAALAVASIATGDFAGAIAALNEVLPFENKGHSRQELIRLHVLRDTARIMQVLTADKRGG